MKQKKKDEQKHETINYFVIDSRAEAKAIAHAITIGFETRHVPLKNFLFQREDSEYIYIYYRTEKQIS